MLVYLDDINIHSATFDEHLIHLQQVFDILKEAGLQLNRDKYYFFKKELSFLGHLINRKGISPDPTKIKKVKDFPTLTNLTRLRSFLRLTLYYRKFVENFSIIVYLLNLLLKKTHCIYGIICARKPSKY